MWSYWRHDDLSPNKTFSVISTLDYEPLWLVHHRGKTDQWVLRPKNFLSLDVNITFGHRVRDFYRGKKHQNFNFPHIILWKYFQSSFCQVCKPKFVLKGLVSCDFYHLLHSSNIFPWPTVSHSKVVLLSTVNLLRNLSFFVIHWCQWSSRVVIQQCHWFRWVHGCIFTHFA